MLDEQTASLIKVALIIVAILAGMSLTFWLVLCLRHDSPSTRGRQRIAQTANPIAGRLPTGWLKKSPRQYAKSQEPLVDPEQSFFEDNSDSDGKHSIPQRMGIGQRFRPSQPTHQPQHPSIPNPLILSQTTYSSPPPHRSLPPLPIRPSSIYRSPKLKGKTVRIDPESYRAGSGSRGVDFTGFGSETMSIFANVEDVRMAKELSQTPQRSRSVSPITNTGQVPQRLPSVQSLRHKHTYTHWQRGSTGYVTPDEDNEEANDVTG